MAAGLSAQAQAMPAGIPIVDLGGLYTDDPAAKKAVAAKIGAACDEIGFFYAVNHNVPVEVIDRTVAMADKFFSQPSRSG
jgi:isopenicillin N synthase-like dioxygenase